MRETAVQGWGDRGDSNPRPSGPQPYFGTTTLPRAFRVVPASASLFRFTSTFADRTCWLIPPFPNGT